MDSEQILQLGVRDRRGQPVRDGSHPTGRSPTGRHTSRVRRVPATTNAVSDFAADLVTAGV
ncbi:hypothetical protein QTQ03_20700 [Micromonospora sp. WMMA1363]|uniref:hypothetical protein n=1 Tax=Micromonospora sp. WMMA1363 TaxID=3053985 RepID=UPI00259D28FF|nr:hypothetical protein [Micromonospora sp. WMMA1363]MDM4721899.1 hypothetical protein [Micromonospora sp. WMMA1363]